LAGSARPFGRRGPEARGASSGTLALTRRGYKEPPGPATRAGRQGRVGQSTRSRVPAGRVGWPGLSYRRGRADRNLKKRGALGAQAGVPGDDIALGPHEEPEEPW
jgi:hypothetical protein